MFKNEVITPKLESDGPICFLNFKQPTSFILLWDNNNSFKVIGKIYYSPPIESIKLFEALRNYKFANDVIFIELKISFRIGVVILQELIFRYCK
jgi:hypothetical protein